MDVFVKLDTGILKSSIWDETAQTRIVWITMLAMADENGHVRASISGIRRNANVTEEEARAAIKCLEDKDDDSITKTEEGRRILPVSDGWNIVNYKLYRKKEYGARRREQLRRAQEKWRLKHPGKEFPADFDPEKEEPEEINPDALQPHA